MSSVVLAIPRAPLPDIEVVRASRHPGLSYYVPQNLDLLPGSVFDAEVARALQRYKAIKGKDAVSLFEKMQAAADYVSNMAKHPSTHNLNQDTSDPRAAEWNDEPEKLLWLAQQNQQWTGTEWIPSEGKSAEDTPALECSYQQLILLGLANALGAQAMTVSVLHHDALAYYDFEIGKWVYIESTFNEHYRPASSSMDSYVPMSPQEIRDFHLAGDNSSMVAVPHPYQHRRTEAIAGLSYLITSYTDMNPLGFSAMMAAVIGTSIGPRHQDGMHLRVLRGGTSEEVFADYIRQGWAVSEPGEDTWAPQGEAFLDSLVKSPRGNVAYLSTNLAVANPVFEMSVGGGSWTPIERVVELDGLVGEVRVRARSGRFVSGLVILDQSAVSP
jgi:hypothetical protein